MITTIIRDMDVSLLVAGFALTAKSHCRRAGHYNQNFTVLGQFFLFLVLFIFGRGNMHATIPRFVKNRYNWCPFVAPGGTNRPGLDAGSALTRGGGGGDWPRKETMDSESREAAEYFNTRHHGALSAFLTGNTGHVDVHMGLSHWCWSPLPSCWVLTGGTGFRPGHILTGASGVLTSGHDAASTERRGFAASSAVQEIDARHLSATKGRCVPNLL